MKACLTIYFGLFWTNEKEHETCNLEVELNSVLWNTLSHLKETLYLVNFKDPIYKS